MPQFNERVYNYESKPPAGLWDKISEALEASENTGIVALSKEKKKSKILVYSASIAAILVVVIIVFFSLKSPQQSNLSAQQLTKDSMKLNNQALEEIITASRENMPVANNKKIISKIKKYLTIAGPEGQPVKISPKVATLIISADNEYPPKAVWNKKIEKWKQIMLTSTLSPTSTNLLDVVQNTSGSVDNNE